MQTKVYIKTFGISDFFDNQLEFDTFKGLLSISDPVLNEPDRAEYGDFQTNAGLANETTLFLKSKGISPEVILIFLILTLTALKINTATGIVLLSEILPG
jgi:hypothetical protein